MNQWLGVDIGDATIKAVVFEPGASRPGFKILEPGGAGMPLESSIGFVPQQTGGVRTSKPIFPFVEEASDHTRDTLAFTALKRTLLPLQDFNEIGCLMAPVLEHLRTQAGAGETGLSLVVPAEYPAPLCLALTEVALRAGFAKCWYVHELTAAVLACLPAWQKDTGRWQALKTGQTMWVLDSGSTDLNLGLVKVERKENAVSIRHLAGGRLSGCDSPGANTRDAEAFSVNLTAATAEMRSILEVDIDPAKSWFLSCGGGTTQELASALLGDGKSLECASESVPATQMMAAGAAVHAAMMSGAAGMSFGTIEERRVLGVRLEQNGSIRFDSFRSAGFSPPYTFEGAYRFERDGRPLEVNFAAALPGGDRALAVESFVFAESEISSLSFAGILVRGHLETWKSGRVGVYDLHRGEMLREINFRLP